MTNIIVEYGFKGAQLGAKIGFAGTIFVEFLAMGSMLYSMCEEPDFSTVCPLLILTAVMGSPMLINEVSVGAGAVGAVVGGGIGLAYGTYSFFYPQRVEPVEDVVDNSLLIAQR